MVPLIALLSKYTSRSRSDANNPVLKPRIKFNPGKSFNVSERFRQLYENAVLRPNPLREFMNSMAARPNPLRNLMNGMADRPNPLKNLMNGMAAGPNPLKNFMNGISSGISQFTQSPGKEDYNSIVKNHIPVGANIITPKSPSNSKSIQLADIDGDSRNELITTYKHINEMKTIILKKENDKWQKVSEISHSGHDNLHYRGVADITGQGKKQLLLGMQTNQKPSKLYGYVFDNNAVNQIFAHDYHRFEVTKHSTSPKACFAIWNKKDPDSYDINVVQWNNSKLEPVNNSTGYFYRKVAPYYVGRVKQNPHSAAAWYNLADSLAKAGEYRDSLTAIDEGMNVDKDLTHNERFLTLKNKISTNK